MGFVKQAMLLLLLAAVGTYADSEHDADPCPNENNVIPAKDVHKLVGKWVLVWATANHTKGTGLLKQLNVSHVELSVSQDNKTLRFLEHNVLLNNSCVGYDVNITLPEDTEKHSFVGERAVYTENGVEKDYPGKGFFKFFQSNETLNLKYEENFDPDIHVEFLLSYERQGHHDDRDPKKDRRTTQQTCKLFEFCERLCLSIPWTFSRLSKGIAGRR